MFGKPDLKALQQYLHLLPGEAAWQKLAPPGRFPASQIPDDAKPSSVLVLLSQQGEELQTLLIQRSSHKGDPHSGQLCFPGGRKEQEDHDLWQTAMREAQEETGIDPLSLVKIGSLSPLYIPISGYLITPFLAWVEEPPSITLSKEEAVGYYFVPLQKLLNETLLSWTDITREMDQVTIRIPYYDVVPGIPLWGATAMILAELTQWLIDVANEKSK